MKFKLYFRRSRIAVETRIDKNGKTYKVHTRKPYGKYEKLDMRKKQMGFIRVSDRKNKLLIPVDMRRYKIKGHGRKRKLPDKQLVYADMREKAEASFQDYIKQSGRITEQKFVVSPFRIKLKPLTIPMLKKTYGNDILIAQNKELGVPVEIIKSEDDSHEQYITKKWDFKTDTRSHIYHLLSMTDIDNFNDVKRFKQLNMEVILKFKGVNGKQMEPLHLSFDYFKEVLKRDRGWLVGNELNRNKKGKKHLITTVQQLLYELIKKALEKRNVSMSAQIYQKKEVKFRSLTEGYQVHIEQTAVFDTKGTFYKNYMQRAKNIYIADKKSRKIRKAKREKSILMRHERETRAKKRHRKIIYPEQIKYKNPRRKK